ncbi:MAG: CvpA family protein [candidate division KSB1 bacterium]|nr:CvpA family protein [candidate division KSB1 bacterium]
MAVEISYADFTITLLIVLIGFDGYRSGFFHEITTLGGFFFSLLITLISLPQASRFFYEVVQLQTNMSILMGFSSIFFIMLLLYTFFLQWLNSVMKMEVVDWFNKLSGAMLGIYKGTLIASLLALGFSLLPLSDLVQEIEQSSLFVQGIKKFLPANYDYFSRIIPGAPSFEQALKAAQSVVGALSVLTINPAASSASP